MFDSDEKLDNCIFEIQNENRQSHGKDCSPLY